MILLTVDLGETSGWCLFKDGKLYQYGTLMLNEHMEFIDLVATHVVLERPALVEFGVKAESFARIVAMYSIRFGKKLQMVRPTDWKQRYGKFPLPGRGVLKTQHERDAYRIGIWYMEKENIIHSEGLRK